MKIKKTLKSLLIVSATVGVGSIASATDHIYYGFNPGSGFEAIGSVGGGYPNSQVLSAPTLNGWLNRLVSSSQVPRDFGIALYASDSPSLFGLISTGFSTSNFFFSGDFAAYDTHGPFYRQYHFTSGFFYDVEFPALDVTSTGSAVATVKVQPLVSNLVASSGIGALPPFGTAPPLIDSLKVPWSEGKFEVAIDGHCVNAKHVAGMQVTQQGIQGSQFGLSKDSSDVVLTVPQSVAAVLSSVPMNSTHTIGIKYYDTNGNVIGTLAASGAIFRAINEDGMADGPLAMVNVSYTVQTEAFYYHS